MTPPVALGRRALLAAALLAPAAARASSDVVVGISPGSYAEALAALVLKPVLGPLGITARQDLASADDRMATLVAERRKATGSLDVACLSDIDMYAMSLLGLFKPVTTAPVPNLLHVEPKLRVPYAIPQCHSALVLLYDTSQVRPAPLRLADLWSPKWKGRVGLSAEIALYNVAMATLAAGGTMNDLAPGKQKLVQLKALGAKIYPSNVALGAALRSGEIWLAPMWRSHGYEWGREAPKLQQAVPYDGAIRIIQMASVPKNAPDESDGMACLNAMLDPHAQLALAEQHGWLPTMQSVRLPAPLLRQIGFSQSEGQRLLTPNYDVMARSRRSLTAFWKDTFGD